MQLREDSEHRDWIDVERRNSWPGKRTLFSPPALRGRILRTICVLLLDLLLRSATENSRLRQMGHLLLRQVDLAINSEVPGHTWRPGIRLTAADADRIFAARDDRMAFLFHHAQVSIF